MIISAAGGISDQHSVKARLNKKVLSLYLKTVITHLQRLIEIFNQFQPLSGLLCKVCHICMKNFSFCV